MTVPGLASSESQSPRGERLWLWLILLALFVRLIGVTAPYEDRFAWRSIDNAAIARNFVAQGMDIRYPRVDWAGPEGYVETELPLQMFGVAWLYQVAGREIPWLGRLVTVFISVAMLAAFFRLARALAGQRAALAALLLLAFSPTSLYFSRTFQQDALMLLTQMLALYHAFRWLERPDERPADAAIVAAMLALGALIKPTALLIGIPIAVMVLQREGLRALRRPALYLVGFGALLPPIGWYLHARNMYLMHGFTFGIVSGGHDKFQWQRFLLQPHWYHEMLTRLVTWHLTPAGLLLTLGGALVLWRRALPHRPVILAWTLTMVAFIPLVAEANLDMVYYQWVALPPLALLAGLAVDAAWSSAKARAVVASLLLLVVPASYVILRPCYDVHQTAQLELARAIDQLVPPGALLLDAGAYDVHNPGGYNFEPHHFYYSGHKGWVLVEEAFSIPEVERHRAMGATHLVSRMTGMLRQHPGFLEQIHARYQVLREEEGILVVALSPMNPAPSAAYAPDR